MHFYAISRRDLPSHQQAIQAAHAQLEFVRSYPDSVREEHPAFVWLTVETKWDLLLASAMLRSHGFRVVEFHDPDYQGYDPSAIACLLHEESRYILSELPLWKPESPVPVKRGILRFFDQFLIKKGGVSSLRMLYLNARTHFP